MSGLGEEQLGELEYRVAELLEKPWDKREGRPRELSLREALVVTCGYLWQNIIEDVWADIFSVAQSTISRYLTLLTPLVEKATEEDRPTEEDAAEATRDAIALVDGTLWLTAATARGPKTTTGSEATRPSAITSASSSTMAAAASTSPGLRTRSCKTTTRTTWPWPRSSLPRSADRTPPKARAPGDRDDVNVHTVVAGPPQRVKVASSQSKA